ncbi:hypothetical protein Moror_45 [Moniliophthora roreri MCA 2997]|uniref:Transmembrane protein n=1 Tax=Moniliophthora roreri (strain MCA 2997) TaxID=1381753 RepID=V2Y0K4_MONRO|nr:hypothetical protein Moror_45 [Moniliophthora roreri MCA 2997]
MSNSRTRQKQHLSAGSVDTNASGIAESAISFSAFPEPPSSIPSTPARSTFSNSPTTPSIRSLPKPLKPNRKPTSNLAQSRLPASPPSPDPYSPQSRPLSPYDWHEGASSIGVDATEDRLLSTSFITSLLQSESSNPSISTRRASVHSDAVSGFSEMTYPPPARQFLSATPPPLSSSSPASSVHGYPAQRPVGSRPPPSSFSPIPETSGHVSDDSETIYVPHEPTVIRSASISRAPLTVVGVAPATLRSISSARPSVGRGPSGDNGRLDSVDEDDAALVGPGPSQYMRNLTQAHRSQSRQSLHSTKAPSVISRISDGIARVLPWKRVKPLPPVPPLPRIPIAFEAQDREEEAGVPLSSLAVRADTLNEMLEKGYHPHQSVNSYYSINKDEAHASGFGTDTFNNEMWQRGGHQMNFHPPGSPATPTDEHQRKNKTTPMTQRKRYCIILAVFIVVAAAAIGAGVGVTVSRRGPSLPKCSSSQMTGMACDLNASCVCTSDLAGQCNPLAQSVIDTIPSMNKLFGTNYTQSTTYTSIWFAQSSPSQSDCTSQALLIDVAPGLLNADHPNRTQWARSALLWNLVKSQDTDAIDTMKSFISKAPWSTVSGDGVVEDKSNAFSVTASGFTFNFASQSVTPPSITFQIGQPNEAQTRKVGSTALVALNRMYSFAHASSTQQQDVLSTYWTSVLQQQQVNLASFRSAFLSSPVLLPFDAMASYQSQSLTDLMLNSSTEPFPPPLSCYPGLQQSDLNKINGIEQNVFGLPAAPSATRFDTSCFADRPIYGVLDVLRLRLPFIDSRTGTPKQAAVLVREVGPRVVLRRGETLASFSTTVNPTPVNVNPRDYGTYSDINHVILDFLSSIPDVNLARSVVQSILSNTVVPPSNDSDISKAIASIPTVEVAVFGTVSPSDISNTVSSFSTPSGTMFFGSAQGQTLRHWSITAVGRFLSWADGALAPQICRDSSYEDGTFNEVWNAASLALQNNVSSVGVGNVTDSLSRTGKLTSS